MNHPLQRHQRVRSKRPGRPVRLPPLVELPSAAEYSHDDEVAAHLVRRSRPALRPFGSRSAVFPRLPAPADANRTGDPLLRLGRLQGSFGPPCPPPFLGAPLLGFFVPLQHHRSGRLLPRGPNLEYRPHPRFRTVLAGILPTSPLRACFIPEALLGFSLQGFPLVRRLRRFRAEDPLLPFPSVATAALTGCLGLPASQSLGRLQGFSLRTSPFSSALSFRPSRRPFPSWVSSSLGVFLPSVMGRLRRHLSCARVDRSPARVAVRPALQSLLHRRWSRPLSRP